ncbi:ras-specific guanine nucleotide-releasing factor 1-like protein [Labeo rohita]|uniref:Ras-specific guanine nucleotide-releasing factor 1-like protein n=1 Tax=Labeo rohita TaxID=84645 RepID=A0A498MBS0_LABRO|nr:ras-specific guanine nucleotide-releasing factor 1-like protein [Labeo rohita]
MYRRNGLPASVSITSRHTQDSSSSESLDGRSLDSAKSFDAVVFDMLKVTPEEFAELASCGWNKKEKHSLSPNVVAFTRRFNQASAAVALSKGQFLGSEGDTDSSNIENPSRNIGALHQNCQVIALGTGITVTDGVLLEIQARQVFMGTFKNFPLAMGNFNDVLMVCSFLFKVSEDEQRHCAGVKLLELNNLHSLVSVVSALQSAPIFRLSKTWALISRKDKATFEKLDFLTSKEENYNRMREYIRSLKMAPCIPYLVELVLLVYYKKMIDTFSLYKKNP